MNSRPKRLESSVVCYCLAANLFGLATSVRASKMFVYNLSFPIRVGLLKSTLDEGFH